jgi:hypothetical protein
LLGYFNELIRLVKGLSFSELKSWSSFSGIDLTPWESTLLIKMFSEYQFCIQKYTDPDEKDPTLDPMEKKEILLKEHNEKLLATLRGLSK